jgi:hypothetical protein
MGTFPFSIHPADASSSTTIDTIKRKLAEGILPWGDDANQGWDDVYTIVRGCWNSTPSLRPPAAYVAQALLDLYARRSITNKPSPADEIPEAVKNSVFQMIVSKRAHLSATSVPRDVALMLERSVATRNDPRSSFLLGAAIWWDLVPVDMFNDGKSEHLEKPPYIN